jgi:hypothetical protein
MIHALSAIYVLLLLCCLAFWPGMSPVPRRVAVYLRFLGIFLKCYSQRLYYRVRLYLINRKLQRLDKLMQKLGRNSKSQQI